jgi:predicted ATP-grasp superfamily ATP-dependent carboligase
MLGSDDRGALSVCRSLGRMGAAVEILRFSKRKTGADRSKYCSRSHFLGEPYADVDAYSEKLLALIEGGGFDFVFPIFDVANELVYRWHDRISRSARIVGPSVESYLLAVDKHRSLELAARLGLKAPPGRLVTSASDAGGVGFPVFVKPIRSALIRDNILHQFAVTKARSASELEARLREALPTIPVLVQSALPGGGVGLNFCAYEGALCAAHLTVRVHEPIDGGGGSYNRTGELDGMLDLAVRFARELSWTGVMMVELKWDGKDHYFMELNCRPWGSLEVSVQAGVDFAQIMLRCLRDRAPLPVPVLPTRSRHVRNLVKDVGWLLARRKEWLGPSSPVPGWLWSFRRVFLGREVFDVERLSDPLPTLFQFKSLLERAGRALLRRVRR